MTGTAAIGGLWEYHFGHDMWDYDWAYDMNGGGAFGTTYVFAMTKDDDDDMVL